MDRPANWPAAHGEAAPKGRFVLSGALCPDYTNTSAQAALRRRAMAPTTPRPASSMA